MLVHVTDPSTSTITTVAGEDIIADSMSIFYILVDVTFAKEFTGDAWTVKPSLDLTLTGNFSDDKPEGTVHRDSVGNLSTNVSSDVLDNFTYGALAVRRAKKAKEIAMCLDNQSTSTLFLKQCTVLQITLHTS